MTCVRKIGNLQTDKLFSFLIRYILREKERIKKIKIDENSGV
jgi:hypothetical protein